MVTLREELRNLQLNPTRRNASWIHFMIGMSVVLLAHAQGLCLCFETHAIHPVDYKTLKDLENKLVIILYSDTVQFT